MKTDIKLPTLEKFKGICKQHDWYYTMSDDFRMWQKGKEEETYINTIIKLGGDSYYNTWHEAAKERGVL